MLHGAEGQILVDPMQFAEKYDDTEVDIEVLANKLNISKEEYSRGLGQQLKLFLVSL